MSKKKTFPRLLQLKAWIERKFKRDNLSHLKKELDADEKKKQELTEKLFQDHHTTVKKKRQRFKTSDLLKKAGIDMDVDAFRKRIFLVSIVITLFATIYVLVSASIYQKSIWDVAKFLAGFWTAGFAGVYLLVRFAGAFYVDQRINARRKQLEAVLPDFLQLTAANIGAGMPIDRALWHAVRPRFGVLAHEIESVAKRVLTGEDLDVALRDLTSRYESPVLERSVNLLLEGVAAGGKIADLLHKISVDLQDQKIMQQEMAASVMTYVIFISFASIIAAPILLGLSTELLNIIQSIAGNLGEGGGGGMISVNPDVISLQDFRWFSIAILSVTAIFSSLIISVIRRGDTDEALRYLPVYVLVSLVLYFLSAGLFSLMFSGII